MNSKVNTETPAHTKQVYAKYSDITTQITAESIAMQRVRDHDHLKYLHLAGVVNAIERDKSIQTGQHSRIELSADLGIPIDVAQEDERVGDIMHCIVSEIMRTGWGVSHCRYDSTVRYQSIQAASALDSGYYTVDNATTRVIRAFVLTSTVFGVAPPELL